MEWSEENLSPSNWARKYDVKRKTFYKSISSDNSNRIIIITVINSYQVSIDNEIFNIKMSFAFDLFGNTLKKEFIMDKNNKLLKECFWITFKVKSFIYPILHTPLLKISWLALIGYIIYTFLRK